MKPETDEIKMQFQDDQEYLVVGSGIEMEIIRSGIYSKGEITASGLNCVIIRNNKNLYTVAAPSGGETGTARIKVFWKKKSSDKDKLVIDKVLEIRSGDQGY